jgi:hypothetical protein
MAVISFMIQAPGHNLGNGVKQGDTLSCSLFILAMVPLIRNIEKTHKYYSSDQQTDRLYMAKGLVNENDYHSIPLQCKINDGQKSCKYRPYIIAKIVEFLRSLLFTFYA